MSPVTGNTLGEEDQETPRALAHFSNRQHLQAVPSVARRGYPPDPHPIHHCHEASAERQLGLGTLRQGCDTGGTHFLVLPRGDKRSACDSLL